MNFASIFDCRRYLARALAFLLSASAVFAEIAPGTLSGHVRNQSTGAFLQGAEVSIPGSTIKTYTERDGSFTLTRIPVGSHTVSVFYSGLEPYNQTIQMGDSQPQTLDVVLTGSTYKLDAFTVSGQREGNAASIMRQMNADNIVNVISTDAYGNIADGNLGNFMQRLPGVSVMREEGEIFGIGLRGIPPNQTSVMVDGALMTAAVAGAAASVLGDRAPATNRLPADFIKEIEVFKAPTPDHPVNGLGGSANLVTKSAFDFNDRVFTYRIGVNQNLYRSGNPFKPTFSFNYMDVLGSERRLAVTLLTSYTKTINTRDRVQGQRSEPDGRNTQARLLNDVYDRIREGYTAKVEYKLTPSTMVGAEVMYSSFQLNFRRQNVQANDSATRRVADYSVVSRAQINAGAVPRTTTNQTASVAPGFTDTFTEMLNANWVTQSSAAFRNGSGYRYGINGTTKIAGFNIRARASYSPEEYQNTFIGLTSTLPGVGIAIDAERLDRPKFTQTYGPSIFADTDFSRYTAQYFQEPLRTEEDITTGQVDAERALNFQTPVTLKAGLMWTKQDRSTGSFGRTWDYVGPDRVRGFNAATGRNDDDLNQFRASGLGYGLFRGKYPQFQFFDFDRVHSTFVSNASWFNLVPGNQQPATEISEEVAAGYVMSRIQLRRLQIVGGVRAENTDVDALGTLADPRNPGTSTTRVTRDYQRTFPSIHFRYDARRNVRLRASYSTSMARPSISQITPNTTIDYNSEVVSQGNTGLLPQYSKNYDLSAEYYFEPAGVVSIGVYQKDISDYIFTHAGIIGTGSNNGFNGNFPGFELRTSTNGGEARIRGLELNYSQSLTFLPKPLDGLAAFANFTNLKTRGAFDNGQTELRNYIPRVANLGLSYSWRKFQIRTAMHYQSSQLISFNANPILRQYLEASKTYDVDLQYNFRPWLQLFADFNNIFNETPSVYTAKDSRRIIISEIYGPRMSFGISGRF